MFLQHRWAASFRLEHLDQVAEEEAVQEIEVYQHHVLNGTTKHASREWVVILGTRPHVFHVEVAIWLHVSSRIFCGDPAVDGPVGFIDRDVAGSIAVLRDKRFQRCNLNHEFAAPATYWFQTPAICWSLFLEEYK